MPVNSTHVGYDASLPGWIRARDLLAGEDAVKAAGAKYLPRLDGQADEDYLAYQSRACFTNATRRAADAFVGLVFRKALFVKIPEVQGPKSKIQNPDGTSPNPLPSAERVTRRTASGIGKAMARFSNDADMLATSLFGCAKNVVREVISVGRSGTLVDWEGDFEQRAYASAYRAEDILNWRVERVNGRNVPTLIALAEWKQRFEGIDPEEVRKLAAEKAKLLEEQGLKAGEFQQVLDERVKAVRGDLQKQVAAVTAERDAMGAQLVTSRSGRSARCPRCTGCAAHLPCRG